MTKPRALYIVHNHPDVRAAGVEIHAMELFIAMREGGRFDASLLAKAGAPFSRTARPHEGTMIASVNPADGDQYLFYNDGQDYDHFRGTGPAKVHLTVFLDRFLRALRPDIVHFHSTQYLGYDAIRQVRNTLPAAAIVHTLHEFLPICHRNGQLLRTNDHERCLEASPRRCHECFPDIAAREFFLRDRFIRAQFEQVDLFLAPSRFLLERYVYWGLPREKIRLEPYGRPPLAGPPAPARGAPGLRARFGYFGQFSQFKGVHVLLQAMQQVRRLSGDSAHLWLHGNNIDLQPPEFQIVLRRLIEETRPAVTLAGQFGRDELRRAMENIDWLVVPSLWWENLPLVIQEAFQCERPVICSDIGGMAEIVQHEVNGLQFRAGDAMSLAETMHRAATTPGLWEKLRAGIPPVYSASEQADNLAEIYQHAMEVRHALV